MFFVTILYSIKTDQLDDVNSGSEDTHVALITEVSDGDILRLKSQVYAAEIDVGLEVPGDHSWCDIFPPSYWRHDAVWGG